MRDSDTRLECERRGSDREHRGLFKLDRIAFQGRHGFDVAELYGQRFDQLEAEGLISVTDEAIELTRRGRDYVDMICALFYLPEHSDKRFARFATEDELEESSVLTVASAPLAFEPRVAVAHAVAGD